jgi:hypothetical protein
MKKSIANQNGRQHRRQAATERQDERKDRVHSVLSVVGGNSGARYCMCAEMHKTDNITLKSHQLIYIANNQITNACNQERRF